MDATTNEGIIMEMFSNIIEDGRREQWETYFSTGYKHVRNGKSLSVEELLQDQKKSSLDWSDRVLQERCVITQSIMTNDEKGDIAAVGVVYELLHKYADGERRKAHVMAIYQMFNKKIVSGIDVIYWEPEPDSDNDDDYIQ